MEDRPVSASMIAERLGLSQPTVSHILSGRGRFSPETRERVRAMAAEMGYRPSASARAMRSRRTRQVGVLIRNDETARFYYLAAYEMLLGLNSRLEEAGLLMTVVRLGDARRGMEASSRVFSERLLDGIVVLEDVPADVQGRLDGLVEQVVWADSSRWGPTRCVRRDEFEAGRLAGAAVARGRAVGEGGGGGGRVFWAGPVFDDPSLTLANGFSHYSVGERLAGVRSVLGDGKARGRGKGAGVVKGVARGGAQGMTPGDARGGAGGTGLGTAGGAGLGGVGGPALGAAGGAGLGGVGGMRFGGGAGGAGDRADVGGEGAGGCGAGDGVVVGGGGVAMEGVSGRRRGGVGVITHVDEPELFDGVVPRAGALRAGDAVVAYDTVRARRVAYVLAGTGLRLGSEVGLACCDTTCELGQYWPELSRVEVNRYELGRRAAGMMVEALEGKVPASHVQAVGWVEGTTAGVHPAKETT